MLTYVLLDRACHRVYGPARCVLVIFTNSELYFAALKKLLKGAELVTSNAKRKTYRKQGDWKKAEQDFFDLNPREIRRPQRGYFRTQVRV